MTVVPEQRRFDSPVGWPRLWLVVFWLISCGGPPDTPPYVDPIPNIVAPVRVRLPVAWDTVFVVGGTAEDTLLLVPRTLAANDRMIAAYDYEDDRLKAFDTTGVLLWQSGGAGAGPGEFEGKFGIHFDADGNLWAVDPQLLRVTGMTPDGEVRQIVPANFGRLAGMARDDEGMIALSSSQGAFLRRLDTAGVVVATAPLPYPSLTPLPDFARSVMVASSGTPVWAVAFPYGNLMMVYHGLNQRCSVKLIGGVVGFPTRPEMKPTFSMAKLALLDSAVVVLADGGGEDRLTNLDLYSLNDCSYLGSYPLPRRFSALAVSGDMFVLEYQEPAPALVGLRLRVPQVQ